VGGPSCASPLRARIQAASARGVGELFNRSRIQTAIVAAIATNVELAAAPGNVLLPARSAGLPRDSVVNVSQLLTLDRSFLTEHAGTLPPRLQRSVDEGLRTVLQL
jgi:mRNA interferase MazF